MMLAMMILLRRSRTLTLLPPRLRLNKQVVDVARPGDRLGRGVAVMVVRASLQFFSRDARYHLQQYSGV